MCEICDLYHQFEEREMKTVTVEVELPEGWERKESVPLKVRAHVDGGSGSAVPNMFGFAVRPIATEKTCERPEWLSPLVQRIKWDEMCGWMVSGDNRVWEVLHVGPFLSRAAIEQLPSIEGIEPADRIWRIVERGEG